MCFASGNIMSSWKVNYRVSYKATFHNLIKICCNNKLRLPLIYDRTRLEGMSNETHHKRKVIWLVEFILKSIHIQKFVLIWPIIYFCQMLGGVARINTVDCYQISTIPFRTIKFSTCPGVFQRFKWFGFSITGCLRISEKYFS